MINIIRRKTLEPAARSLNEAARFLKDQWLTFIGQLALYQMVWPNSKVLNSKVAWIQKLNSNARSKFGRNGVEPSDLSCKTHSTTLAFEIFKAFPSLRTSDSEFWRP